MSEHNPTEKKRNSEALRLIAIGGCVSLAALWGASYFCGVLPKDHWAIFPALLTGVGFCGLGFVTLMFGFMSLEVPNG